LHQQSNPNSDTEPQLLIYSANDQRSINETVRRYEEYADSRPGLLRDLAYTLALRRDHNIYRAFSVRIGSQPVQTSSALRSKFPPRVVLVFTGQGAQWAQMGVDMLSRFHRFAQDIDEMQKSLLECPHPPSWSILGELKKSGDTTRLASSEFAQPLLTVIQVGLVNLLFSWGVVPAAVVGHSSGEIAAAYASGAISMAEAVIIAYYRGRATTEVNQHGGMVAVGLGKDDVTEFLKDGVVVACENSPQSVTLSGDKVVLQTIMADIRSKNSETFVRELKVEMAYHSHHMKGIGKAYEGLLGTLVHAGESTVPFYSSVSGNLKMGSSVLGASYWRGNLESPVLFNSAVNSYLKENTTDTIFVEVGPQLVNPPSVQYNRLYSTVRL
jgi:acyl transferase domain-containing protein